MSEKFIEIKVNIIESIIKRWKEMFFDDIVWIFVYGYMWN